jgi:hypothetical protein
MSAAPHTTLSAAHPRHSIESVMDHFRYCADMVGIEHVAFGPDTLYGDHVALHRIFARLLSIGAGPSSRGPSFDPVAYVDGLENPTENFGNICGWLVQHGYDDADIRAVLGGNIYRALQLIWVLTPPGVGAGLPAYLSKRYVLSNAAEHGAAEHGEGVPDGWPVPLSPDQPGGPQRSGVLRRGRYADAQAAGEFGGAARINQCPQRARAGPAQDNAQVGRARVVSGAETPLGRVDHGAEERPLKAGREQRRAGPQH